jgi:hypothetical protein
MRIKIMGMASHLGPWLLGTQKNTIGPQTTAGAQAGQIRNMGATVVAQFKNSLAYNDAATTYAFTLPAGSLITAIEILQTTTFTGTSGVITVYANGTALATCAAITAGTAGVVSFTGTAAQMATWSNVGTSDVALTYTMASSGTLSAGAGTLVVRYVVRNSDGTSAPTSSQA